MRTLIKNGTLVNEGQEQKANLVIENDTITDILTNVDADEQTYDEVIDATNCIVMPGVIDSHVHFREPGMTHKGDMCSESRAAVYGGVTSVFDMPNTIPQTTCAEAMKEKQALAKEKMSVNYAFFPGATVDNTDYLRSLDIHTVPGIKLFMGSSTGNMLVDTDEALAKIFAVAHDKDLPIMAHCEDMGIINANATRLINEQGGTEPTIYEHDKIRSREACIKSSNNAIKLAERYNTRLHIAHISTAEEVENIKEHKNVTGEATVAHLTFIHSDCLWQGANTKCNPAIKDETDREALRQAVGNVQLASTIENLAGTICTIGTDHAPHTTIDKFGGALTAASGIPSIQFALPLMMQYTEQGILRPWQVVALMCHHPALLFGVSKRGYLRKGYKADITIMRHNEEPHKINFREIQGKWHGTSPYDGMKTNWTVERTIINGHTVYNASSSWKPFDEQFRGEAIRFRE